MRFAIGVFLFLVLPASWAAEPDDSRIIQQILETRAAILHATGESNTVFLAIWDFDGTILKGDCSEGFRENGKLIYPGLAQWAIEHGLSQVYPPAGGFEKFWTDYKYIDERVGHWLAYPFIPQILRGAKVDEVRQICRDHFSNTLSNYLYASSLHILQQLARAGVQSQIISASAEIFVQAAAASVGIPTNRIHGIEVRIRDGRLTEELVYPVTWNVGKRQKLRQVVATIEAAHPGTPVYVLAGFGDSFNTDGPFLEFIAKQSLPAGKPISVLYNHPQVPPEYQGLFYLANQSATVSGK